MSEWVSRDELAAQLGYKILLAGLSEAGKTAVKRVFFLKQSTKDVDSLGATINYERMTLNINNVPVTIVDLGGQKVFLKRFLSGFSPFVFSSVKILVFLIDTANKSTRNSSIQYFAACLEKLISFSPDAKVFVFLHKNDLVRHLPNYESVHAQLKEQFQLEYPNDRLNFFRTTIYKPETIVDSFGRIFELALPKIAKSEFVDHREIGRIEELAEKEMTIREEVDKVEQPQFGSTPQDMLPLSPVNNTSRTQSELLSAAGSKIAGDVKVLERLQNLLRDSVKDINDSEDKFEEGVPKVNQPFLGSSSHKVIHEESNIISAKNESKSSEIGASSPSENTDISVMQEQLPEIIVPKEETDSRINHFMNFYGLEDEKARKIVISGYDNIFESVAATSAIEIPFIVEVLLNQLPFIKSKGVDIGKLDNERLFMIFFSIIKGDLKKEDIVECITIAVKEPDVSIDEIAGKIFARYDDTVIIEEEETISDKASESLEIAHLDIPIEIHNIDGVISLPDSKNLGFKVKQIESNIQIEFHDKNETKLHRRIIGRTQVSASISVNDIIYLMVYELNMLSSGLFNKGKTSIKFSAQIIHNTIQQVKSKGIYESENLNERLKIIIPVEIKIDKDYLLLPDTEKVSFNITKVKNNYILDFRQRGFHIGNVPVDRSDNITKFREILVDKMQIPIESEGAIDFAARIIHAALTILVKVDRSLLEKKNKSTEMKEPEDLKDEDDDSTEKLKNYLKLLER